MREPVDTGVRHTGVSRRLFIAALILSCAACTGRGGGGDVPAPDTLPTGPAERSSLVVLVSSQSYNRDKVTMRVEVDGHLVVKQAFTTGGGHNVESFPLDLAQGDHRVTVTA